MLELSALPDEVIVRLVQLMQSLAKRELDGCMVSVQPVRALGQWGHDALGFAVHVPHYIAQSPYPRAAVAALENLERSTGLELASGRLEASAAQTTVEIDEQVTASAEIGAVVRALEEQYDAYVGTITRPSLLSADIPTADELGAEFEKFLAQQDGDGLGA